MGQRRYGYEAAFEDYLRSSRIPYVSVNEAQRTLRALPSERTESLKSFDFVVYGEGVNLLVDIKGRKGPSSAARGGWGQRLESWVTREDVTHLLQWETLFGSGFRAVFVFAFAYPHLPADGMFAEVYQGNAAWYALRAVGVREYAAAMRDRSPRWGTVELPGPDFERAWRPLEGFRAGALLGAHPAVA